MNTVINEIVEGKIGDQMWQGWQILVLLAQKWYDELSMKVMCFWTLSVIQFVFRTQRFRDWILCTSSGGTTHLSPIDRASPYFWTPAQTPDRVYIPSTAKTVCDS
jgi:hypothetical protein